MMLLAARVSDRNVPFHELADRLPWDHLPRYNPGDSIADETAQTYHAELQERARAGDRYAASMLRGHAYNEPSDD